MSKTILVIEDEASIATLIQYNLEKAGYNVIICYDGKEGLDAALTKNPDLIILDLMLPTLDGMDICKEIRGQKNNVPIIMLTARDDEFDKVLGLELGADDYMTKPFSPRELVARVRAVLRRFKNIDLNEKNSEHDVYSFANIKVFPQKFEVLKDDELVEFTPKEFELLIFLLKNKNRVLTRDHLLSAVWNYTFAGDTRIVDVHISHLREKLEENSRKPKFIKTIRGIGYKFEEPK